MAIRVLLLMLFPVFLLAASNARQNEVALMLEAEPQIPNVTAPTQSHFFAHSLRQIQSLLRCAGFALSARRSQSRCR